jgi:hypothetical protein
LRGLTDGELIETPVALLLEVSEIKTALSRLQSQAWYLFRGVDQGVFFGQTANVTAEVTEIAANIATDIVVNDAVHETIPMCALPTSVTSPCARSTTAPGLVS